MSGKLRRPVEVGDDAPDFALTAHTGVRVTLGQFRGQHPVVLFFYPRDNTPGCTKEACAFRDHHGELAAAGAVVLGISGDGPASHAGFAGQHGLPYLLLSDEHGTVRGLYGVPATMGLMPGRVTYVIGRDGRVAHVFNNPLQFRRHPREALKALRALGQPPPK